MKARTHTHTMSIRLGVYVLMCMSVYLHKWKTNTAHNLSMLCTQHHTVYRVCTVEGCIWGRAWCHVCEEHCCQNHTTSYYQCNRLGVFLWEETLYIRTIRIMMTICYKNRNIRMLLNVWTAILSNLHRHSCRCLHANEFVKPSTVV